MAGVGIRTRELPQLEETGARTSEQRGLEESGISMRDLLMLQDSGVRTSEQPSLEEYGIFASGPTDLKADSTHACALSQLEDSAIRTDGLT